ncbi:DUF6283 family protein [Streptomyces sp. NPDC005483]|uniref:DUF6283 family protein n=1 Tax=Streptomyces sp. NPDC005483 TaxID=3154882 RepID=UPI0033A9FD85
MCLRGSGPVRSAPSSSATRPTLPSNPRGLFQCHQTDADSDVRRICGGWAGCHEGNELLALRMWLLNGLIDNDTYWALVEYVSPVPLFSSGSEAAAHGASGIDVPDEKARLLISKITRTRDDIVQQRLLAMSGARYGVRRAVTVLRPDRRRLAVRPSQDKSDLGLRREQPRLVARRHRRATPRDVPGTGLLRQRHETSNTSLKGTGALCVADAYAAPRWAVALKSRAGRRRPNPPNGFRSH